MPVYLACLPNDNGELLGEGVTVLTVESESKEMAQEAILKSNGFLGAVIIGVVPVGSPVHPVSDSPIC